MFSPATFHHRYLPLLVATSLLLSATAAAVAEPMLQVSAASDRSDPLPLSAQRLQGSHFIFTASSADLLAVAFYLDDPELREPPLRREEYAPFDLAGTASGGTAEPFDTTLLSEGLHTLTARISYRDGSESTQSATFEVDNDGVPLSGDPTAPSRPVLSFSDQADRSGAIPLADQQLTGSLYLFSSEPPNVVSVTFYLDDPAAQQPFHVEGHPPFDLVGTARDGSALPFDTTHLSDGEHTLGVQFLDSSGASWREQVTFYVNNGLPTVPLTELHYSRYPDRRAAQPLADATLDGIIYPFATATDEQLSAVAFYIDDPSASATPWRYEGYAPFDLAGTASDGNAHPFDLTQLTPGAHQISLRSYYRDGREEQQQVAFWINEPTVDDSDPAVDDSDLTDGSDPADSRDPADGTDPTDSSDLADSNQQPIAYPDYAVTDSDQPITIDILANDIGLADTPIQLTTTAPQLGSVTITPQQTLYYTPSGSSGEERFDYQISDRDGDQAIASVTITLVCGSDSCSSDSRDYQLRLQWQPVDGVDGYAIMIGRSAEDDLIPLTELPITTLNASAPRFETLASRLDATPGDAICLAVQAYNSAGYSAPSTAACATL